MKMEILEQSFGIEHLITEKDLAFGCGFSLALHTDEDEETIHANRVELEGHFGAGYHFCGVRQIHSAEIAVIDQVKSIGWKELSSTVEADALITDVPQVVLTILTADCVPILLYDPVHRAIGAVHAGWKGTHAEILPRTIAKMQEQYGSQPQDIIAAIAPAIGQCCYEVGAEVAEHFVSYAGAVVEGKSEGKYQLDLKRVNQLQAEAAGVLPEHIEVTAICTACERERFFSYRAEQGCSGRFVSAIAIQGCVRTFCLAC